MGLLASLGWGDFLRLEEEEEGEGERAAAGLCRPETDGETIVGTRMAFWDAVSMCVCECVDICLLSPSNQSFYEKITILTFIQSSGKVIRLYMYIMKSPRMQTILDLNGTF